MKTAIQAELPEQLVADARACGRGLGRQFRRASRGRVAPLPGIPLVAPGRIVY